MTPSRIFSAALLRAHGLIGLLFCAAIYLVCVSGTLAVLIDELTVWERPEAPRVESVTPERLAAVATAGYARARAAGFDHDLSIITPSPTLPQLIVFAYDEGRRASWAADASGRLRNRPETPWTDFVRDHHYNLHLPAPYGAYLVGIIGTILLASLISGVLAHRRIIRDAFRLRWGGSRRLANADLHNRIGVWALPFHLIVSLTGSLLGLAGLIIGVLALIAYQGDQEKAIGALLGPMASDDHRPAPLPDIAPMIRAIEAGAPGSPITYVRFDHAGTAGQIVQIAAAVPGHLSRMEAWTFAPDGRLLAKAGFTDGSVGMRIYGMVQPLHFGTYGGIWIKLIYVVLGTGLCTVIATGVRIWLIRRREQGRPVPVRECLWVAFVWGQIPAFALAAASARLGLLAPLASYWLVVALTTAGMACLGSGERVRLWSVRLASASLAFLVCVSLATGGAGTIGALVMTAMLGLFAAVLLMCWGRGESADIRS
jgi:uncharacterized iron-regulated membrane protein